MDLPAIVLLALALAMDAFAVSIASGITIKHPILITGLTCR
jgi:putative Mn2+ efflux pump MntP